MHGKSGSRIVLFAALVMGVPRVAHAYVDPGTGAMAWQVLAAAVIGCMFYVKRVAGWIRSTGFRSPRAMGFFFASFFALIATPATTLLFMNNPLPRFNDIFLVGIVLTAYLFTWDASAYLLVIALLVSSWVLPPYGSLRVASFVEAYRLLSFAALSVFLICLITRLKNRLPLTEAEQMPLTLQQAAAGAD